MIKRLAIGVMRMMLMYSLMGAMAGMTHSI
jgi:hypothetical protein